MKTAQQTYESIRNLMLAASALSGSGVIGHRIFRRSYWPPSYAHNEALAIAALETAAEDLRNLSRDLLLPGYDKGRQRAAGYARLVASRLSRLARDYRS